MTLKGVIVTRSLSLLVFGAMLTASSVLAAGWVYRPDHYLIQRNEPVTPASDESRVGSHDGALAALVDGSLWLAAEAPDGTWQSRSVGLPNDLRKLARSPGGLFLVPSSSHEVWVLHGPSEQWWRWDGQAWEGPGLLPGVVNSATALPGGKLILNVPRSEGGPFLVLSREGAVVAQFGERLPARLRVLEGVSNSWLLTSTGGRLVAAHAYRPLLRSFNEEGQVLWELQYETSDGPARRSAAAELEAQLEVDPETCCVEAKMPRFATAVASNHAGVFIRNGLDRSIQHWNWKGEQEPTSRVSVEEDPWLIGGLTSLGDDLVAYDRVGVRLLRRARIVFSLDGRVSTQEGEAIEGATVDVVLNSGLVFTSRTDSEGRFSLLPVDRSLEGWLKVKAEGFLRFERMGPLAELAEDVRLVRSPSVCVLAEDESGRPIETYAVTASKRFDDSSGSHFETGPTTLSGDLEDVCVLASFPLPWLVTVVAQGYASADHSVAEPGLISITLQKEETFEVRIQDEEDLPVPNAVVAVERASEPESRVRIGQRDPALSDSAGKALVHGLGADRYRLTVEIEGFLRHSEVVEVPLEQIPHPVKLTKGAVAKIGVIDRESGRPVEGAEVQIDPRGHLVPQRLACTTDSGGQCEIPALPVGRFEVYASADGKARGRQNLEVGPSDKVVNKTVHVSSGVRVTGVVRGIEYYPDANLAVEHSRPGAPVKSVAVTGRGDFLIENAAPGQASLWVEDRKAGATLLYKIVEIPDTGEHFLTVDLPPPILVTGRVLDGADPCGSCSVVFTRLGADIGPPSIPATVSATGRYTARLTSAGRYRVGVSTSGGRGSTSLLDVNGNLEKDLAVDAADLTVIVLDRAGQGVEGASVHVVSRRDGVSLAQGITGLGGVLRLAVSETVDVSVTAFHENRSASVNTRMSSLTPVRLTLGDPDEVYVSIIDGATGLRVPAVSLRVIGGGATVFLPRVAPGGDGLIVAPRIAPGPLTLIVHAIGYAIRTQEVSSLDSTSVVALTPGGRSFLVRVDEQLGSPCSIELRTTYGRPAALSPESLPGPVPFFAREAMFNLIEPGEYVVRLQLCSGRLLERAVSLYPGSTPTAAFAP